MLIKRNKLEEIRKYQKIFEYISQLKINRIISNNHIKFYKIEEIRLSQNNQNEVDNLDLIKNYK